MPISRNLRYLQGYRSIRYRVGAGNLLIIRPLLLILLACFTHSKVLADLIELDTHTAFDSVYLLQDPHVPVTRVDVIIRAGEVDVDGPEGLAHYLEHLMFWHADNVDGKSLHVRGGGASVNRIVTNYFNEGERGEKNFTTLATLYS